MKPMEENKSQLLEYTMRAGLLLGLFWSFKYLFTIFGMSHPALNGIGTLLSLGTPLLLFYFLVKYNRDGSRTGCVLDKVSVSPSCSSSLPPF